MKPSLEMTAEIENSNLLRREAGLPLLQVNEEIERLIHVAEQAEFERYYEQQRHRYEHLFHPANGRGHLSNMGVWITVRRMLRDELLISPL